MPKTVSRKQQKMMHAIMEGKEGSTSRGDKGPPKSVAAGYSDGGKSMPESKGKEHEGGRWPKGSGRSSEGKKKKKSKKDMKKSFEEFTRKQGAGIVVVNDKGQVLLGKGTSDNIWQTPGGHVDEGEDFIQAAARELEEEAHITSGELIEVAHHTTDEFDAKTYVCHIWTGTPKSSNEVKDFKFFDLQHALELKPLRPCSRLGLEEYAKSSLKKSTKLKDLLLLEKLEKNIMRGGARSDVVYDVSHGDALRLVGNGCFRFLKKQVAGMGDEDFKDIKIDTYTIKVRKHNNDVYSGRIVDGYKMIHQFTNKSLPQLCADVMSVFEWYSDDDNEVFDILDEENLSDDAIHGGLSQLSDNYKKHNLANIYTEMNNIREEIRSGNAVDLQQVEKKIMSLFDKLECSLHCMADKHNQLAQDAGHEVQELENKLRELQHKVDELHNKPTTVEAYQTKPVSAAKVHNEHYMYLPRPQITVGGDGKIVITFNEDWTNMEKSNFLHDMKAKVIKRN